MGETGLELQKKQKLPKIEKPLNIVVTALYKFLKGKCLDLGCGEGKHKTLFPDDVTMLDFRSSLKNYVSCDLNREKLPFEDNSFDTVFSSHVLEHLEKPGEVIKEVFRVLKKGGLFIVGVPNPRYPFEDFYSSEKPYHINKWGHDGFKKFMETAGFEIISRYYNHPSRSRLVMLLVKYTPLRFYAIDFWLVCKK